MAIASAVFWIMLGLAYVAYLCYKEHPKETLIGVLSVSAVLLGLLLLYALSMPFREIDPILGWAFITCASLIALYFLFKKKKSDEKKASEKNNMVLRRAKKDLAMRKLAEHLAQSDECNENT